jgi:hypothetical protein
MLNDVAPRPEPLAYDVLESCRLDGTGRSTKYKAINPDPRVRGEIPFLPSFTCGRRRLILAADHLEWLKQLRAASMAGQVSQEELKSLAQRTSAATATEAA